MRIALCQLPISPDPAVNLARVADAVAGAARQGADLAVFPEATQARFGSDLCAIAEPLDQGFGSGLAEIARRTRVALVAGVFEPARTGGSTTPPSPMTRAGARVAAYRKIHLFDSLGEHESAVVAPGSEPVVADLAGIRTGFATCYDIRFPELARALVAGGAELIVVPAAWAAGLFKEEHWVTLVRARAIENTVWVAAAGQVPDSGFPADPGPYRDRPQHAGRPDGRGPGRPRAGPAGDRGRPGQCGDRTGPGGTAMSGAPARRCVRLTGGRAWPGAGQTAGPLRAAGAGQAAGAS